MLRHESFPQKEDGQCNDLPPAGYTCTCITEQAAERAIYLQSVKKAPGPDMQLFGSIQLLGE